MCRKKVLFVVLNNGRQNIVEAKFKKTLLYEGFQYGEGDIVFVSEQDTLHLYGVGDAELHSSNLNQNGVVLLGENDFVSVHGKQT